RGAAGGPPPPGLPAGGAGRPPSAPPPPLSAAGAACSRRDREPPGLLHDGARGHGAGGRHVEPGALERARHPRVARVEEVIAAPCRVEAARAVEARAESNGAAIAVPLVFVVDEAHHPVGAGA